MAQKEKQEAPKTELALMKRDIVDVVNGKIQEYVDRGQLHLPANYSVDNAIKSAWLILQSVEDKDKKPALSVCTRDSIANALLNMAVQGLNPAKNQCHFIVHGKVLVCRRSYFGTASVARRVLNCTDVHAEVVYADDEFEYEIRGDRKRVIKHDQKLENIKMDQIVAAYCVITYPDERPDYTEIMTWDQILTSWKKAAVDTTKANSPHKEFPDQMAKRTVINRACKLAINMTGDQDLLIQHFNQAAQVEAAEVLEIEADEFANNTTIDIEQPEQDATQAGEPDKYALDESQERLFGDGEG